MDASTHVNIAEVTAMGDKIAMRLWYDTAGQHSMFLRVTVEGRKKETLIGFQPAEWVEFKRGVIAIDEAVKQLRKKEQIFDFTGGPASHGDEPRVELPPAPRGPHAINIDYFMASKVAANGEVVRRECRTLAEIEDFKREVV